jgi:hypothetical protein
LGVKILAYKTVLGNMLNVENVIKFRCILNFLLLAILAVIAKFLNRYKRRREERGEKRPQCLLCMKILAAYCMKTIELNRRLETVCAECVGKNLSFFPYKTKWV